MLTHIPLKSYPLHDLQVCCRQINLERTAFKIEKLLPLFGILVACKIYLSKHFPVLFQINFSE